MVAGTLLDFDDLRARNADAWVILVVCSVARG